VAGDLRRRLGNPHRSAEQVEAPDLERHELAGPQACVPPVGLPLVIRSGKRLPRTDHHLGAEARRQQGLHYWSRDGTYEPAGEIVTGSFALD
jgi:hypothetical protein